MYLHLEDANVLLGCFELAVSTTSSTCLVFMSSCVPHQDINTKQVEEVVHTAVLWHVCKTTLAPIGCNHNCLSLR